MEEEDEYREHASLSRFAGQRSGRSYCKPAGNALINDGSALALYGFGCAIILVAIAKLAAGFA
ncbi:hypothetical protein [Rhizobium miluonense]|uniref:hypothetical protein n=1 Tax=Rhizobium miluonense TaxID=411945 RepID=UPI001111B0BA|nr:hypothetical protein [Rhizobium miluonense]